jgi:hypothetical protein
MTTARVGHVQVATLGMDPGFDERAPGGAVTVALCGALEHDPPCPLAPHHTTVEVGDAEATIRVVFACDPAHEFEVRSRIDASLAAGTFRGPNGVTSTWRMLEAHAGHLDPSEEALADGLLDS